MWYYEDNESLTLDFGTINKFARLKVAVPSSKSELTNTYKEL